MLWPASEGGYGLGTIVLWMAVMMAGTLVLVAAIIVLRRWINKDDEAGGTAWTLHELSALRDAGELTIQQYERLKAKLITDMDAPGGTGHNSRKATPKML